MKRMLAIGFGFCLVVVLLQCSPNECKLSESFSVDTSPFVLDKGFNKYTFKFAFEQKVEVYRGECAADKNVNRTNLKLTSFAPCDQVVNFTINIGQGEDSYQIKKDSVAIKSEETIDFGTVRQGGGRIDFAEIDIALFCPLCPGDEE